jgi:transposase
VCWNITRVSLWLLCNVHFVQITQRTRLQKKTIRAWYKQFTETGFLCKQKSSGRPLSTEDDVERVRASFLHSPKKSTGTAAKELSISKTKVWRVLRRRMVFKSYRIQMVQQLSDEDHRRRLDFCLQLQD